MKSWKTLVAALGTLQALPAPAQAYEYTGRILLGGFTSTETFHQSNDGSSRNDFATASSRFYLQVDRIQPGNLELTCDVRDQHDLFDLLDRERLELTPKNTFQIRQLSVKSPSGGSQNPRTPGGTGSNAFYASAGRFPIPEAGNVFTDGAEIGWKWTPTMRTSIFGGLNPKRADQRYVEFHPDSRIFGAYFLYQPVHQKWETGRYLSEALVANQVASELDRLFWFQQFVLQPDANNRFVALSYLDFVPRVYLQNANLSYSHDFNKKVSASAGLSVIDVIEYTRRRDIRETLPPSPYREGVLRSIYRLENGNSLDLSTTHGIRLADGQWRHEYLSKLAVPSFFTKNWSTYLGAGFGRYFVSNDVLVVFGGGYYSNKWELTLDETMRWSKYDNGTFLRPLITELNLAHYLSKSIYVTLSFENAMDLQKTINTAFFKIGYRFGTHETAPLRDGAPPRGKL